jgi:hypothetical protein
MCQSYCAAVLLLRCACQKSGFTLVDAGKERNSLLKLFAIRKAAPRCSPAARKKRRRADERDTQDTRNKQIWSPAQDATTSTKVKISQVLSVEDL